MRKVLITIAFWIAVLFSLVILPARFQSAEGQGEKVQVPLVPIPRNAAWNDLQRQAIAAHDNLDVVHQFLVEHQTEVKVEVFDVKTFRAIDEAAANLKVAQKDLAFIRSELEYKEQARK